jgi:ABC-2 type transport system ATP-binding protein
LQEVEAVCDKVLILNEGLIAAQGTSESIAGAMKGGETWDIVLKGGGVEEIEGKLARVGLEVENVAAARNEDGTVALSFFIPCEGGAGEAVFDWAVAEGLKILSMNKKKLSLEDIFVRLTNEQGDGGAQV